MTGSKAFLFHCLHGSPNIPRTLFCAIRRSKKALVFPPGSRTAHNGCNRAPLLLRWGSCYVARAVLVRMRMDIRPRCCVHRESVMVPVEVCGQIDEHPYSFRAFACEAGCERLYNIVHGYFQLSDGKISSLGQFRVPCPNDESPMYVESADLQESAVRTYRCSQFGCDGKQTVRGLSLPLDT